MQIIPYSSEALVAALEVLRAGGVVAHATETCYGLACDISNSEAVKKVFAIKKRPLTQPISALFQSVDEAKMYVEWNDKAGELANQYLPGPLTMILPMREDAPMQLFPVAVEKSESDVSTSNQQPATNHTIGVRISSSTVAQSLVEAFNRPLSTTSANIHGQPNPYSAEDIAQQFAEADMQPDVVIDSGQLPSTPPSTVVNLADGSMEQKRAGDVKL